MLIDGVFLYQHGYHLFKFNGKSHSTIYLRCYFKGCISRASIKSIDLSVKSADVHYHKPDVSFLQTLYFKAALRRAARTSTLPFKHLYDEIKLRYPIGAANLRLNPACQMMRRWRLKLQNRPSKDKGVKS
ncbi:hypothetical protein WDU94_006313 [Cyamophila willieti]